MLLSGYGLLEYQNNRFRTVDYGAITTPAGMDFFPAAGSHLPADAALLFPIPPTGDGGGKAVLSQQPENGHRRGAGQRRDPPGSAAAGDRGL